MEKPVTAREWLRQNGYDDVADLIDSIMQEWKEEGKGTRRDWWEVLAGKKNGEPAVIYGRTFPVLRAAQIRQQRPITSNAIWRNDSEEAPPVRRQKRWAN